MIHIYCIEIILAFSLYHLSIASTSAELLINTIKETKDYDPINNQTLYSTNYTNKEMNSFVDLYITHFYKLNEHKPYLIKGSDYNISVFNSSSLNEIDCTQCLIKLSNINKYKHILL